jgi:hypothetical protein
MQLFPEYAWKGHRERAKTYGQAEPLDSKQHSTVSNRGRMTTAENGICLSGTPHPRVCIALARLSAQIVPKVFILPRL